MTTIHTNPGALVAQQTLRNITTSLDKVSKQVQTGYRVADAKDDASTFAVAQGLRNNVASLGAVQQGLSGAVGLAEVGLAGATAVSNLFSDIKAKVTQLADSSISATQRTTYSSDLAALPAQAKNLISQASVQWHQAVDQHNRSQIYCGCERRHHFHNGCRRLRAAATFNTSAGASDHVHRSASSAKRASSTLNAFITKTNDALSGIAADLRAVEAQNSFTKSISDATEKGLGALVDADLAKASSKLQALQAQQQLSTQAITIANQAPSVLLALFRG